METKMDKIIKKWFENHATLSKDNFALLKEMEGMFLNEPIDASETTVDAYTPTCSPITPTKRMSTIDSMELNKKYNRGNTIAKYGNIPILSNVLDKVKHELEINPHVKWHHSRSSKNVARIMKEYYPYLTRNSLIKYVWAYRRYIQYDGVKPVSKPILTGKPMGTELKQYCKNKVYSNIATDMINAIRNGQDTQKVLREYYPMAKNSTLKTYRSLYTRYFKDIGEIETQSKTYTEPQVERNEPTGAYKYNDMYSTYVLKKEVDAVTQAISKVRFDYTPTVKSIAEETDMSVGRVRATLNTLILEKKVGIKTSGVFGKPVYYLL